MRRQGTCQHTGRKSGPLGEGVRRTIESADAEQLLEWGERFVTAGSVEEMFDGKG